MFLCPFVTFLPCALLVVTSAHRQYKTHQQQHSQVTMTRAIAVLKGDTVSGTVLFEQKDEHAPTRITGAIKGMTPGLHGFHVHQFGDLSNGCKSAGPHFNPFKKTHGGPNDIEKHIGDLGNIKAESDGTSHFDITSYEIELSGALSIIGRAIVLHANPDDFGKGIGPKMEESLKTGNSGARIACGVVGNAQ